MASSLRSGQPRPLRAFSLFAEVGAPSLRSIEASRTHRQLRDGERIWWMGDLAEHVTLIDEGLVQIVRTGASGELSMIGMFGPGDTIGLTAALEGGLYPADAVVISSRAEIVRVSATEVRAALATDPALAASLQRALLEHTKIVLTKVSVVSAGSVAARLATLFEHLADRFGTKDSAGGMTRVDIVLTRATVAAFVDARVETVIRALSEWRSADVFRTTDRGFEIDRAALAAIAVAG
jgi:CRP/FNR family transcriptional regulator